MADCDWAGLSHHILGLILGRLPFPDFIKSRAVCKSWLVAWSTEVDRRKPWAPMLMLAGDATNKNSEYRTLFSLSDHDHKFYRLHLPQIRGQRVLGTADGWLVTVDNDTAELQLVNAFTRAVHVLPSITTLSIIAGVKRDPLDGRVTGYKIRDPWGATKLYSVDFMHCFHRKAVLFSSLQTLTVFITYGEQSQLAFARVGDERWTELRRTCYYSLTDIVLHRDVLWRCLQLCWLRTSASGLTSLRLPRLWPL